MTSGNTKTLRRALYVATDLTSWETDTPAVWARDVGFHGTCYRQLDPGFYAWLRRQVERAKDALEQGRLAGPTFEKIRQRFNAVHAWALEHLGETALRVAVGEPAVGYSPPTMANLETVRLGITDAGPRRNR